MHNPSTIALPSPQVKAAENTALDEVLSTIRVSDMGGGESGDGRSSEGEGGVDAAAETTSIVSSVSSVAAAADFHTNTMKKIEAAKAQVRSQPLACMPLACSQPFACADLPHACTHAKATRNPFCTHARQGRP